MTFSDQSQISGGNANTLRNSSDASLAKGNENLPPDSSPSNLPKVPKIITASSGAELACASPIAGDDLLLLINTKSDIEFCSKDGSTFVRAESGDGKISIQSFGNLKGGNVFKGANIVKFEVGTMSKGKFIPQANQFLMKTLGASALNKTQTTEKPMAKKPTEKKSKNGGKIAFVDELLLAGKSTKNDVAEALNKKFSVPIKTAKNTVSWCASTMKERTGKVSKHLPSERAVKVAPKKVAKVKVPKRTKKTVAPKEVAPAATN